MKTEKELKQIWDNITGQITFNEALFLYRKAVECKGHIIEIGSFQGKSTVFLALGARENGMKVFAIDPHKDTYLHEGKYKDSSSDYFKNLLNYDVRFNVDSYLDFSYNVNEKFHDGVYSMLFIDGDHSYDSVKQDFELYFPKLRNGGLVCFHDYGNIHWEGVTKFVNETKPILKEFNIIQTIASGVKC